MYVIGHQAIAKEGKAIQCAVLAKEVDIDELVGIAFEDEPARVCALRNVMWNVDGNDSGQTSHGAKTISEKLENVPSGSCEEIGREGLDNVIAEIVDARTLQV